MKIKTLLKHYKTNTKSVLPLFLLTAFFGQAQIQIGNDIDGENRGDRSGFSVSLSNDGSILAIGAPNNSDNGIHSGNVRIYKNINSVWTQIGDDIDGENDVDQSGYSISLSADGSIVAIGARYNNSSFGHVRVYKNINGVWTQIGNDIDGENDGDQSGYSISLSVDGSIVAIGAPRNDNNGNNSGHVRVYKNINSVWTQIGNDIDGEFTNDGSGDSLSLSADGSVVAIGAYLNDGSADSAGHVRVYKNTNGVWTQVGNDIDGEGATDISGKSVSLSSDGHILAIGAPNNDGVNGFDSGHVRVYENVNNVWVQVGNDIDGEDEFDYSGISVNLSADGSFVAIGSANNNGNGPSSGHVRVYKNMSGIWTQVGNDMDGEGSSDLSGSSISLSEDGSIVAIGAYFNDGNGSNSGHVRVYDLSSVLSVENAEVVHFTAHPNPVTDILNIKLNDSSFPYEVNIYNSLGQLIVTNNNLKIDLTNFESGLYFVEVISDLGKSIKKIIIK